MKRFLKWFFRLALRISAIAAAAAFVAFIAERIGEIKAYGKELRHKPYGIYERFVKRPLDCFLSTGALIVFSPILLVLTILGAIKMGGNPFSPLLKRLDKQGYINRIRPDDNERKLFLTLTEAGEALKEQALEVPCAMEQIIDLSQEELRQLKQLLEKALRRMERNSVQ